MLYTGTYQGTLHTYCSEFDYTDLITFTINKNGYIDLPWSSAGILRDGTIDSSGHISDIAVSVRSLSLGDITIPYAASDDGTNFYASGTSRNGITSTIQAKMVETTRETILREDGNDLIAGNAANNYVDGGAGVNTYFLQGVQASYQISLPLGSIVTVDLNSGRDGMDTLVNVQRLKFADSMLAFDVQGNAGQVYRLYQAAFDRTPDIGGLSAHTNAVDHGLSLHADAASFVTSPEFALRYGSNASDQEFVTALYNNVLDRAPDAAGNANWMAQLSTHTLDRASVLIGFSESPENHAKVDPTIAAGIHLDYGMFV